MSDGDSNRALRGERDGAEEDNGAGPSRVTPKTRAKKLPKKAARPTPGIVYISRLPPGMTPQKVRHLMARWGEVGKVYAQRRDAPTGYDPNHAANEKKRKRHAAANYTEAWVEFLDKSVAKTVARLLNAEVIGGKKGDRWRDDIWTMKYLSGFKWEMLGAQVAYEKQAHQSRLNAEISRARTEQSEYLKNVELARVLEKRQQKRLKTEDQSGLKDDRLQRRQMIDSKGPSERLAADSERKQYRQREVVPQSKGSSSASVDGLLSKVFA